MARVEVEGVDTLVNRLNQLGALDSTLVPLVRKQAEVVRSEAVRFAPVYSGGWSFVHSGELRQSIHTTVRQQEGHILGTVYTNLDYAPYVEYGTGPVGIANHAGISPEVSVTYRNSGWTWMDPDGNYHYTEGMAAQPFMYPALKNNERTIQRRIKQGLERAIDQIADGE